MDGPQRTKNSKNIFGKQATTSTKVTSKPKKPAISMVGPPKEITYDVDVISEFLTLVFGTEIEAPESPLTWFTHYGSKPCWATPTLVDFYADMKTRKPAALYFATATVRPDVTGKLYNRQESFEGLYVLVLDDVGTKIPHSAIPSELEPTYDIISSPGNHQLGLVLAEPIRELEHAKALVALLAASGLTDDGGAMVNKLVRLPGGLNGKKDLAKGTFPVELVYMDGPYWTPQGILSAIGSDVKWSDVLAGCDVTSKRRGASKWAPNAAISESVHGITDVVLEWLYEQKMVYQDVGDWVMIRCPEETKHSDNAPFAYYSPLGRGGEDFAGRRGFKCFHGHGKTYDTKDFLQYVASNRGPQVPVFDPCAALVRDYVYDAKGDLIWRVTDVYRPTEYAPPAFGRLYPHSVTYVTGERDNEKEIKVKSIKETSLWNVHPCRVSVHGTTLDPRTNDRIVTDSDGRLRLNLFARSDFGTGEYDQAHVDKFMEFLTYLIPKQVERDYFLDWISAKYQDMTFRGNAILMIATCYGVGRGTLADMLHALLGRGNAVAKDFSEIINPKDGFTDWKQIPLVIVNETKSADANEHYKASFEALKKLIDPRPTFERINTKNTKKIDDWVYTSMLMFSNHIDAVAGAEGDRRIYVTANPARPASPEYFIALNAWMDEKESDDLHATPVWAKHVGRWLSTRTPDVAALLAPAPMTSRKRDMIASSRSEFSKVILAIVNEWPIHYVTRDLVNLIVDKLSIKLALNENPRAKNIIWKGINNRSAPMHKAENNRIRVYKKRPAVRLLAPETFTTAEVQAFEDTVLPSAKRAAIGKDLEGMSDVVTELSLTILASIDNMG